MPCNTYDYSQSSRPTCSSIDTDHRNDKVFYRLDNHVHCAGKLSGDFQKKQLKVKGKGPVLDIALLHDEHMLRSALQTRKWQPIGMS